MLNMQYTRTQKILHWVLAVLLLFWLFVSGELAHESEGDQKLLILAIHSAGALVILGLMIWRFVLRRRNTVMPMEALKPWEKTWSVRTHLLFYGLVVLMVASGLLQGVFYEVPIRVAGILPITAGHNETLMAPFHETHEIVALILKLLIGLHVLAAIKHQFIDHQPIFKRML